MSKQHTWKTAESAARTPLVEYIRSLGPAGTLVTLDTSTGYLAEHYRPMVVASTLRMLQKLGVLRYSADKGSPVITVRLIIP
jgi:hypothetical protein